MSHFQFYIKATITLMMLSFGLTACNLPGPVTQPTGEPPLETRGSTPADGTTVLTATAEPTSTALPEAARVNGFVITQPEYEAELKQFQASVGRELTPEDRTRVLNSLVDEALLAAAAFENDFKLETDQLDQRFQLLAEQAGGETAVSEWMQANGHTRQSFEAALRRAAAAAWMRDQIIAEVPRSAEQVHARQILLYTAAEAQDVYGQLQAGNDFGNLALKYDPITRGDLGWFPRGFLTDPKLDEVAFNLQPEAFGEVVQTQAGFHILQVLERETERPLSPEALLQAQIRAVQNWLLEQRSSAQIENLQP